MLRVKRKYAVFLLALTLAACGGGKERSPAPVQAIPEVKIFIPPSSGRLTEKEVQGYIVVRRTLRQAPPGDDSFGGAETAAARLAGVGPDEYLWAQMKVEQARLEIEDRSAAAGAVQTYRRTIAALQNVLAASTDPATRALLTRQIAGLRGEMAQAQDRSRYSFSPDETFNVKLVEKYLKEIDADETK